MFRRLILAVLLVGLGACSDDEENCGTVAYRVQLATGCTADVTYEGDGGSTLQQTDVPSGWSYQFQGCQGDFVYVSAQNNCDHGAVTVYIQYKGNIIKQATSSGAFVIATASGSL